MQKPDWPKHPDGRPFKMGEMSRELQDAQVAYAIECLKPEFARIGGDVHFGGSLDKVEA